VTGYSGTPLLEKLGIDQRTRLVVSGAPSGWVELVLRPPPGVRVGDLRVRSADVIVLFCPSRPDLEVGLPRATQRLRPDGALWVAWPKRASGVATDMTEDAVREVALPTGLVDVKVAALDATWSGLKLMVRRENRALWGKIAKTGPKLSGASADTVV